MRDTEKSKEALLAELRSLRQQVADLEHRIQIGDIAPSITPREQAEEALRESHDLLRAVIEGSPDMIFAKDVDYRHTLMNTSAARTTGRSVEDIIGKSNAELFPPEVARGFDLEDAEILSSGKTRSYENTMRIEGSLRTFLTTKYVYKDREGKALGVMGIARDITERKRAEELLREKQQHLTLITNSVPVLIAYLDKDERYLFANHAYERMVGRPQSALIGYPVSEILGSAYAKVQPHIQQVLAGEAVQFEIALKDEHEEVVHLSVNYAPDYDEDGATKGFFALLTNITERKQAEAERERMITELEAKNTELERFAYTVSHDLKSPLVTVKLFLGLLQKDAAQGNTEGMERDIAQIHAAADKMNHLLDDLLELSRVGRLMNPPEAVNLTSLAHEAVALVAGRITERGVEVEIAPEMPVVHVDRARLLEVLLNLVDNAVKYMGEQPAPRVEIGAEVNDEAVVCYVRDNGIGINPRYHEKIFGLFEQLDQKVEGTGIGLTLIRRIVVVHGGRIWVESEGQGRGSTFWFTLPRKQA